METFSLVINATPDYEGVLEDSRHVIHYYDFLFDSLLGRLGEGADKPGRESPNAIVG